MEKVRKVYETLEGRKRMPNGVEESIRLAIIKGVLQPETRLEEKEIAEEFLMSETSLRESLLMLEYDGYITLRRGAGYYVTKLEKSDLKKMYELASILTKGSINAIDNTDPFVRGLLEESVAAQEGLDGILQDRKFHVSLAIASKNVVYIRATKEIYDKIEWWYRTVSKTDASFELVTEHEAMIRAIVSHTGDDYSDLMEIVDKHYAKHLKDGLR